MEKMTYERARLVITEFDHEDVITTSAVVVVPTNFTLSTFEGAAFYDDDYNQ